MTQIKNPTIKMVPPDGGWGWMVVIGVSLVNMATRSIEPSFGLLFGDLLSDLGVATTGAAVIMSTMDAMINLSGIFVGPICKYLSFRKVSLIGSFLNAFGLILTFPARSFYHIIVTYSIVGGTGTGLASSATFFALNHYFYHKRGQAVGLSLAGTAFGMMLFPQAIKALLEEYGFRSAILILGAANLNSIAGSLLLQPAEWHFKPEFDEVKDTKNHVVEMEPIDENDEDDSVIENDEVIQFSAKQTRPETQVLLTPVTPKPAVLVSSTKHSFSGLENDESIGKSVKKNLSVVTLNNLLTVPKKGNVPRNFSAMSLSDKTRKRNESVVSMSSMDFTGSSIQLHLNEPLKDVDTQYSTVGPRYRRSISVTSDDKSIDKHEIHNSSIPVKIKEKHISFWNRLTQFLDLDLLSDGIYLNLLFGLSLFYVAEQNFKMVTPFFFASMGYTKSETAFCLSVTATIDIAARIILPPICDRLSPNILRRKTIFMITSLMLAIGRSFLAIQTEWNQLIFWFTICGFLRGCVLINFTLTVSEWCPTLEKLPAAFGLQMVAKGLFVIIFGPLLGFLRDKSQSYPLLLHVQNILILCCVLTWTIEYIYVYCIKSTSKKEITENT